MAFSFAALSLPLSSVVVTGGRAVIGDRSGSAALAAAGSGTVVVGAVVGAVAGAVAVFGGDCGDLWRGAS